MVGDKNEHSAIYYMIIYCTLHHNALEQFGKEKEENLSNKTLLLDVFIEHKYNDVYNILQ